MNRGTHPLPLPVFWLTDTQGAPELLLPCCSCRLSLWEQMLKERICLLLLLSLAKPVTAYSFYPPGSGGHLTGSGREQIQEEATQLLPLLTTAVACGWRLTRGALGLLSPRSCRDSDSSRRWGEQGVQLHHYTLLNPPLMKTLSNLK